MVTNFPTVDRKRLISSASKALLSERHPAQWELTEQGGGSDFGFDYSVQVAPAGQVTYTFRAQLKGTESPSLSADGQTLSIGLKRTTLNMYATTQDEVMLLLAVVQLRGDGKLDSVNSRMYWCWLAPELERLRGSRYTIDESEQETFAVHVPVSRELTSELDVTHYLELRRQEALATETLESIAQKAGVVPAGVEDPMQQLVKAVVAKPLMFFRDVDIDDGEELDDDGLGSSIAQALSFVRAGQTSLAEDAVSQLDRALVDGKPVLKASLLSVEGKIAIQRRRRAEALALFEQAYALDPAEHHLLACAEVRFLEAVDDGDKPAIAAVAASLAGVRTDEGLSLLVRVQVATGDFAAAHAIIGRISETARAMPYLVVLSGERRWADVRAEASRALAAPKLKRQDAMGLRLVAARACWSQALSTATTSPDKQEMPLTGAPGIDIEAAKAAWAFSKDCLLDLKKLGWQPNIEILAPIAMASAAAIAKHEEALPLVREAAAARPEYQALQENLELLAIGAGNTEAAMEANLRLPETQAVLVRRACLQFQAQQFSASLDTALRCLANPDPSVEQTPMAFAMGAAAATKLARSTDADRLIAGIRQDPSWAEFEYFARFAQHSLRGGSKAPLTELREGLQKFPESRLLLANLFSNLSADSDDEAGEIAALARRLRVGGALSDKDWFHLALALLKLARWEDAERECRGCIDRFGETDRTVSLLAIAVEMQGRTGEAIGLLERALTLDANRAATLHNYLGLCLRLGRTEAAQLTIEKLLGLEGARARRLELLRLNALLLSQLGRSDDAYAVVRAVADLVDQDVELEEGMYLNLFMSVTLRMPRLPDAEHRAIEMRTEKFAATWPGSRLFKVMKMSDDGEISVAKLNSMLGKVLGGDPQQRMREYMQREAQARSGQLPVPFVARPSFVFHYIGDVFTLWEYSKKSKPEDRQYHLVSAFADQVPVSRDVLRDVPLLDLSALLVLHDLGLFEVLFSLFPRVAISQTTVSYITQHARGVFVNELASKSAESLLRVINANLERIDQPATSQNVGEQVNPRTLLDDYVSLAKSGRWAVYSDDAFTHAWVSNDRLATRGLGTLDLMRFADEEKLLSPAEVGKHLVQLASWNVEVLVVARYFLAT
jgi:tetratricopeptide (TPR) repeat protein